MDILEKLKSLFGQSKEISARVTAEDIAAAWVLAKSFFDAGRKIVDLIAEREKLSQEEYQIIIARAKVELEEALKRNEKVING